MSHSRKLAYLELKVEQISKLINCGIEMPKVKTFATLSK